MAENRKPDRVTDDKLRHALAALTGGRAEAGSIDRASLGQRDQTEIVGGTGTAPLTPAPALDQGPEPPAKRDGDGDRPKPLETAGREAGAGGPNDPIALDIAAALDNIREVEGLAITISGVPGNARLSAGSDNGDGTWTLGPLQLDGLTLAADATGDITLTVTAAGDTGTLARLAVTVEAVADATAAAMPDPTGGGDVVALGIAAALVDIRDTRGLAITVAGLPETAGLTAGTDNGDGTWSLDPGQLDGLGLILPPGADGELVLGVTASDERARTVARLAITVETLTDAESVPLRAEKPGPVARMTRSPSTSPPPSTSSARLKAWPSPSPACPGMLGCRRAPTMATAPGH